MLQFKKSALKYYSNICEVSAQIASIVSELLNLVQQLISAVFCKEQHGAIHVAAQA